VLSEKCGVVKKVREGTGHRGQRSSPFQYSTPHMYTVDFDAPQGTLEIDEWPLEHASN
jgi:hypothetical protein